MGTVLVVRLRNIISMLCVQELSVSCQNVTIYITKVRRSVVGSLNASEQSPRSPTVYDESVHTWLKQERTGIAICPPNSSIFDMCVVVFDVWIEYQLQQSYYFALHHELLWS